MIKSKQITLKVININVRLLSTPSKKATPAEIELGLKRAEKWLKFKALVNSVRPDGVETSFFPKDGEPAPLDKKEIRLLAELPEEEFGRKVLIEPRMMRSAQQGVRYAHQWQISWISTDRWTNPLMGWTSTNDTMSSVKLFFDKREDAIAFAERNSWTYQVKGPTSIQFVEPGHNKYADNFLPKNIKHRLKQEGIKNKIFITPGYGKSNWFMPLNFHGTKPVEQYGPQVKK